MDSVTCTTLFKTHRIRPTSGRTRAGATVAVWGIYSERLEMGFVQDATDGALGGSAPSAARAAEAVRFASALAQVTSGRLFFCNPLVAERG